MASTFTPNVQFEEPARGDQVGTWDTPVNSNQTLADLIVGGITTIALNNSPVVLAAAQFQCKTITFNSTLTGSVTISFPSSFKKSYEIQHLCTGSSAFVINLAVTGSSATAGQTVAVPPGVICEVLNDGNNIKFKNFGIIGEYMDIAATTVPNWIGNCTVPPYLDCNGAVFSAVTYPQLAIILAGTTLPDARGRAPYYLNEATGRLTSAGAGIDGNTIRAAGGTNGLNLNASHIPTLTSVNAAQAITVVPSGKVPVTGNLGDTIGSVPVPSTGGLDAPYNVSAHGWAGIASISGNNSISVTYTNAGVTTIQVPAPGFVSGLRLIRAA